MFVKKDICGQRLSDVYSVKNFAWKYKQIQTNKYKQTKNKTKQNKQNKTKQNKTKQNKTKQNKQIQTNKKQK